MNDPLRGLLANLRARLGPEGVGIAVGGAFALAARGFVRGTDDLDLMVLTPRDGLLAVQRALQDARYGRVNEVTYRDGPTGLILDILPVTDAAQRDVFQRAVPTVVSGVTVPVLTADGLAVMLLREWTQGSVVKRPQRLLDLQRLSVHNSLGYAYIRGWVRRMGYEAAYGAWQDPRKPPL